MPCHMVIGNSDITLIHIYASRFFAAISWAKLRKMFVTLTLLKIDFAG